jgi:hypothetical protein
VDADVDVHAAGTAGLGPAAEAYFFEEGLDFECDEADIGPVNAGAGVEVDAELVGVIEVGGADWVGVEFDAAEVDDPCQAGFFVYDEFLRGAA